MSAIRLSACGDASMETSHQAPAPERVLEFLVLLMTELKLPGEGQRFDLETILTIHRKWYADHPLNLQALLIRACEFYSLNLQKSRERVFMQWVESLNARESSFAGCLKWRPLVEELLRTFYFISRRSGEDMALLNISESGEWIWITDRKKLRACWVDCVRRVMDAHPDFIADGQKLLGWLQTTEAETFLDLFPVRKGFHGDFSNLYRMLDFPYRSQRIWVQPKEDPLKQFEALAQVSGDEFLLVGYSGHGFIYRASDLSPWKKNFRREVERRIVQPGHALTKQLFPLSSREKIVQALCIEMNHPENETVQAFCRRLRPYLDSEEKKTGFTDLVNYFARHFPIDFLVNQVFPYCFEQVVVEDFKDYFSRKKFKRIDPFQCAYLLRTRYNFDEQKTANHLFQVCNAPQVWSLGDLVHEGVDQKISSELYLYLTFDVVGERLCLLQKSLSTSRYHPLTFLGSWGLKVYIPDEEGASSQ